VAKVLIFNNFLRDGQKSILHPIDSRTHDYHSVGPGRWQANPYARRRHIQIGDLFRRVAACIHLYMMWRRYDFLIVDSAITAFFLSMLSFCGKGRRALIVASFNVPRRRKGFWRHVAKIAYRKVDHFFVHSRFDIQLSSRMYGLPEERFTFRPFVRKAPATGRPARRYLFEDNRPFVLSYGANARDYQTFFQAVGGADVSAIAVGRDFSFSGLSVPENVRIHANIPLEACDKLVGESLFCVFTFDGSEPSCGQISIVTALMLGKPVICTDWVGVHDYISDGENGLLVKMKDPEDLRRKMMLLISNKDLYERLCVGARAWAAENTDASAVQKMVDDLITRLTLQRR